MTHDEAVKWLESIKQDIGQIRHEDLWHYEQAISEIQELLKEQDAKKVIESTNMYTGLPITHCPKCGVSIDKYLHGRQYEGQINHCPFCGQEVKWE